MISVAGMEGGSGDGTAASRKAGWLRGAAPARYSVAAPRTPTPRAAAADLLQAVANAALDRLANSLPPATNAPQPSSPYPSSPASRGPDGRPLPPDGSAPPQRTPSGRVPPASLGATASAAQPPEFSADGRPLPPNGATAPARPQSRSIAARATAGASGKPQSGPIAPAGHTFVARPVSAPPGEFRFAVRCSCGRACDAPVTLAMLREAMARGLPPAEAITLAQQAALNAMHRN